MLAVSTLLSFRFLRFLFWFVLAENVVVVLTIHGWVNRAWSITLATHDAPPFTRSQITATQMAALVARVITLHQQILRVGLRFGMWMIGIPIRLILYWYFFMVSSCGRSS